MDSLRKRNFFIDIRGIRKLRDENIFNFIAKNLKLTALDVAAIQIDRIEGKVFVELKTQEAVQAVVDDCDNKFDLNNNGTIHRLGFTSRTEEPMLLCIICHQTCPRSGSSNTL